jgi:hypothetical protein
MQDDVATDSSNARAHTIEGEILKARVSWL